MKQGNVKWFDCKKGYGFITPDGEVKDVFVHITQLEKIGIRKTLRRPARLLRYL